jgi:hypothetical protein
MSQGPSVTKDLECGDLALETKHSGTKHWGDLEYLYLPCTPCPTAVSILPACIPLSPLAVSVIPLLSVSQLTLLSVVSLTTLSVSLFPPPSVSPALSAVCFPTVSVIPLLSVSQLTLLSVVSLTTLSVSLFPPPSVSPALSAVPPQSPCILIPSEICNPVPFPVCIPVAPAVCIPLHGLPLVRADLEACVCVYQSLLSPSPAAAAAAPPQQARQGGRHTACGPVYCCNPHTAQSHHHLHHLPAAPTHSN